MELTLASNRAAALSDLLFCGLVIEESITSQLIDQRVLQQSEAPSATADSNVSADNQQKRTRDKNTDTALAPNGKRAYMSILFVSQFCTSHSLE